jgi:hypothetical protein
LVGPFGFVAHAARAAAGSIKRRDLRFMGRC